MWTSAPAPIPSAAMIPSRRPPRAALAITNVISAPGTTLSARPASAKARNIGNGGRSSMPATLSMSEVIVHLAAPRYVRRRWKRFDVGRQRRAKLALPAGDDARRDRITDDVCGRTAHVEEMVDREDQQQPGLGNFE